MPIVYTLLSANLNIPSSSAMHHRLRESGIMVKRRII